MADKCITAKVKAKAAVDIFRPPSATVEEVLLEDLKDVPCPCLPKPEYIARVANRHRQRLRPQDPTDLNFDVEEEHIPDGFLRGDIQAKALRNTVPSERHSFYLLCISFKAINRL